MGFIVAYLRLTKSVIKVYLFLWEYIRIKIYFGQIYLADIFTIL